MAGKWERLADIFPGENHSAVVRAELVAEIDAMSPEDFRTALEVRLCDLPNPLVSAFAARSASCALPFLAKPGDAMFLGFWNEADRDRYLLAVLRAVQIASGNASFKQKTADAADAADAARAADDAAAYYAAYAAYAAFAVNAAKAAADVAVNIATHVADAAVDAADKKSFDLQSFLLKDLDAARTSPNASAYLARPLPTVVESQVRLFIARLRNHGSGFDWWADWYEDRLQGRPLDLQVLEQALSLPESLLEQGAAAVNAYLKSLTQGSAIRPLNRVRVLFIGYGQSGKTSLIRALHGETVEAGKEDMTPGIDIRDWLVPDTEIKAHFWDFGGQVMAHATHQFFLRERCVYVLVMEPRAEINANQQAQYWLEHVRLFGKDAPVLLVGNKADRLALHLDLNTLKEGYPNIVGFFPLSCTGYRGDYRPQFEIFQAALVQELQNAGTHQLLFTLRHFGVLEDLRNRPKDQAFLEKQEFEQLCEKNGVQATEDLNRDWLLDLLDKLGMVVHFPDFDWLDAYVLNPRWLTYGVYTLLYSEEARNAAGRLIQKDAIAILARGTCKDNLGNVLKFPSTQCRFILEAMQRFELCYVLPDAREIFILPDLLPSDRPEDLDFDKSQALAFDFDFEALLPRHLMTGFIVRRHEEISEQRVWQNGVRLQSRIWQAEALVQSDHHRRRLSLWVTGDEATRYFTALHDEFMRMLDRMKMQRTLFQEWVVLPVALFEPGTELPRADFRDLLALEASGKAEYVCKYGNFNLAEVLKIMPKDEREKQSRTNIFNGPTAYAENGTFTDVTFGNKTVVIEQARELDGRLADSLYRVRVDVDEPSVRDKALRELEMIREALEDIQKGDETRKRSALQVLGRFSDHLKEGTSGTVKALKTIKDGGEAINWLRDKAPLIIAELASLLG